MGWKICWLTFLSLCIVSFIYSVSALQTTQEIGVSIINYPAGGIEGIIVVDYGIIPYWEETELIKEVAKRVSEEREYKLDLYDCTQFSSKLVKELKKEGIKAQCTAGYYLEDVPHTWVSVFLDDLRIEVEATRGYIIPTKEFEKDYNKRWENRCW